MGQPTRTFDRYRSAERDLVTQTPALGVAAWSVEGVRATFLRGGELVPPASEEVRREAGAHVADVVAELTAAARARSTRRAYGGHVERWLAWAEKKRACPLPASRPDFEHFLLDYGLVLSEEKTYERDADGKLVGRVVMGTLTQAVAALARLHRDAGLVSPSDDPHVGNLLEGLRRTLEGGSLNAKAALTWDLLTQVLEPAVWPTSPSAVRAELARALHQETGATAGQLSRLLWSAVSGDGLYSWVVLPPSRRGAGATRHSLARDGRARALLEIWRPLVAEWPGTAVFRDETGKALTRQGLHKILERAGGGVGGPVERVASLADVRDRAVLLVGWMIAARRSELAALNWDDLVRTGVGWQVTIRRSKTDQRGKGRVVTVAAAPAGSSIADPAGALDEWLTVVAATLGRDPRALAGVPVFGRVNRHGQLVVEHGVPRRLSGSAISGVVQRRVRAAGLERGVHLTTGGRRTAPGKAAFAAHSLRAGFVTDGHTLKLPREGIKAVTGHKTDRVVDLYYRAATAPDLLAATSMLAAIASAHSAPTGEGTPRPSRGSRFVSEPDWGRL